MNLLRLRPARLALAVSATALGSLAALPATPAQATGELSMVALGDSSAAAPLVGWQSSWDCLRSSSNWPALAAQELGATLTDVTCSGATTADLTGRRFGYIPAQLDAVKADTDIVTIAIGANDLNLGATVPSCMNPLPEPAGVACTTWQQDNTDSQLAVVAPKIAAAVQKIHQKAPAAQVYLVSYMHYWDDGGCYPTDPIWDGDTVWLQSIFTRVNTTLRNVAQANGATYVDLDTPSTGHGTCADPLAPGEKWVEGLVPTSQAMSYHPNQAGNTAAGHLVAAAIGS